MAGLRRCRAAQMQMYQTTIYPLRGQFFLHRILPQARFQAGEINTIQRLILIETGKDVGGLAGLGIDVRLQALGANFFHHALHR